MAIASPSRLHAPTCNRPHSQVVEANYLAANSERLLPTIWHLAIAALTARMSLALLFYDHFLTFDREVRHIWARKRSASSILFFGIRYPALAVAALTLTDLVPFKSKTDKVCKLASSSVPCADSVVSTDVRTLPVFGTLHPLTIGMAGAPWWCGQRCSCV